MDKKAVVVHAGRRDNYQVALAMQEAGLLEKLVTDFYFPGEKEFANRLFKLLNKSELLHLRFIKGLPSNQVCSSVKAMWLEVRMKLAGNTKLNPVKDTALGNQARELALKTGSALISYSTYAHAAFKSGAIHNRFLFQLHPHPLSVRGILKEELELTPSAAHSLQEEYELSLSKEELDRFIEEPKLANGWMAASTYTAKTLAANGVDISKIHVIPYGIDTTRYTAKQKYKQGEILKVIFIGSFSQRKGLSYLLQAIRMAGSKKINLTLVGRGITDMHLLSLYKDLDITLRINVSHTELVLAAHDADVFVLPSLVEGFAQVILEAMSCGLPVITTENTAGPDIITDGKEGFIVPIRDPGAIAKKLTKFIENKQLAEEMGRCAVTTASLFTWDKFKTGVVEAYKEMLVSSCE